METIEAPKGDEVWWNESSAIFSNIVNSALQISKVKFKHCPREANQIAHELARVAYTNKNSCSWRTNTSSFMISTLIEDVIII
jgi:hypothetical protein